MKKNIAQKILHRFLLLSVTLCLFHATSCNKDKEGRINVKINYNYSASANQTVTYSATVVKLYKNNSLLDTKIFDTNESNISFGIYEYGDDYSVNCSAKKNITETVGSASVTNSNTVSSSKDFKLNTNETTVEVPLE